MICGPPVLLAAFQLSHFSDYWLQADFVTGMIIGLLLSLLLLLIWKLMRRQTARFEAFTNDAGKILISRLALQEQIQRCCEELEDVGRCRVLVSRRKNLIETEVEMRLRSNSKLVGVSGYLQQQIEQVVRENLGVENVGPIDIIVTGILPPITEKATSLKLETSE